MPKSGEQYQPSCIVSHHFINKLSVIIGCCDLLMDKAEEQSECSQRLRMIREVAKSMADEINLRQQHVAAMTRTTSSEDVICSR